MLRTSFVIIAFLIPFFCLGDGPVLIGKQQGLNAETINMTVQDKDNFLWIGSNAGLFRYDGKSIIGTKAPGLATANVTAGYLDNSGLLWLGTYSGDVYVYDGLTFRLLKLPDLKSPIIEFKEDKNKNIYAVSRSTGILEFKGSKFIRLHDLDEEKFLIYTMAFLEGNKALLGTESGLKIVDLNAKSLHPISLEILSDVKINQVIPHASGGFWVATEDQGVFKIKLKPTPSIVVRFDNNNQFPTKVTHLSEDGNLLWIGTKSMGVYRINFGAVEGSIINIDNYSSGEKWENPTVTNFFRDREGNYWVSTFNHGILKFPNEIFSLFYGQGKLVDSNVSCIENDHKDNFWVGTLNGLYQLNFNESKWKINDLASLNLLPKDKINAICKEGQVLWVGTQNNGLIRFDTQSFTSKKISFGQGNLENIIRCMEKVNSGEIWVGTSNGIFILDSLGKQKNRLTTENGLPHNAINSIQSTSAGRIWIATAENKISYFENGLIKLVRNEKYDIANINSICEDGKGHVWFASNGAGLYKFDGQNFKRFSIKDGLSSDYCYQVQADHHNRIWVSHQKGLSSIVDSTNKIERYLSSLGNQSYDFTVNSFYKGDNTIWLCTDIGVLRYCSKNESLAKQEPKVLLTYFRADSTSFDPKGFIQLPYGSHSINIQFISPFLKNPDAVRYKFMLKGYDKGWSDPTPLNIAFYSSLYDGEYEFLVKACNEFGVWTKEPASIKITIKKPFFKEWWFFLLVVSAFFLVIYFYIKISTKRLIADKLKLEGEVKERTKELELRNLEIEENKNEIERNAKNITDSIRYAKRIQKAIYPTTTQFKKLLPESFIFFKAKGIVSGDFYWLEEKGNKILFAACDCTGHGVPGAFISIVASNLLNQAVKEHGITKPSQILEEVNRGITISLHQTEEDSTVRDGMDAALCCFDRSSGILEFSGAYNNMYLIREGELIEYKADNIAIGNYIGETLKTFTNHEIFTLADDVVYIFSDGFADQFGGPEGKKIKKNTFKKLLLQIWSLPMEEQREKLYNFFKSWQGELEQVDDVLVIGVRIKTLIRKSNL